MEMRVNWRKPTSAMRRSFLLSRSGTHFTRDLDSRSPLPSRYPSKVALVLQVILEIIMFTGLLDPLVLIDERTSIYLCFFKSPFE